MNWTGGSLQRHSKNANRSIMNRQKQHFAKTRTSLQNGCNDPTVPFRPSYLKDDDTSFGGLPSIGSGSVRHTGHSKRPGERERRGSTESPPWGKINYSPKTRTGRSRELTVSRRKHGGSPGAGEHASTSPDFNTRRKSTNAVQAKRKASDIDAEHQLLEANRQRLLRQQDWVGLEPLRPVNMHFATSKEKHMIGKRRKIDPQNGPGHDSKEGIIGQPATDHEYQCRGPYMSGALKNDVEEIRIRIGTDALSSQTPMQPNEQAPSPAAEPSDGYSSDSMLFDHEERYSAPEELMQPRRSVTPGRTSSGKSSIRTHAEPQQPSLPEQRAQQLTPLKHQYMPEEHQGNLGTALRERTRATDLDQILRDHAERHISAYARSPKEEASPNFHVTQILGGIGRRPIRLIFDQSSDVRTEVKGSDRTVQHDKADTIAARGKPDARVSGFGHAEREIRNEHGSSRVDRASLPVSSIIEDGPWKAFLDIPERSSSPSTAIAADKPVLSRRLQQPVKKNAYDPGPTAWSSYTTMGDRTSVGRPSSLIPASLSPTKWSHTCDNGAARTQSRVDSKKTHSTTERESYETNEGENLWKSFVFQDDDGLASETLQDKSNGEGRECTTSEYGRSDVLPSCVAVASSASTTLLPTLHESAPVHSSVQDASNRRLPPTSMRAESRSSVSPIDPAYAENHDCQVESNLQARIDGLHPASERSGVVRGRSVTHASFFNDASHDTFSSGTFGSGPDLQNEADGYSINREREASAADRTRLDRYTTSP